MTTYEGETPDGTRVHVHVEDGTVAYLITLAPGDHSTWSRPLELRSIPPLISPTRKGG